MTEMVKQWIADFAALGEPAVDALDSGQGCGLFPLGRKVVRERSDILGGRIRLVRHHWKLKLHLLRQPREGDTRGVELLEALGAWLEEVSGFALTLENARLAAQSAAMARYEADLYMECIE